jgi:hypothetical protein
MADSFSGGGRSVAGASDLAQTVRGWQGGWIPNRTVHLLRGRVPRTPIKLPHSEEQQDQRYAPHVIKGPAVGFLRKLRVEHPFDDLPRLVLRARERPVVTFDHSGIHCDLIVMTLGLYSVFSLHPSLRSALTALQTLVSNAWATTVGSALFSTILRGGHACARAASLDFAGCSTDEGQLMASSRRRSAGSDQND